MPPNGGKEDALRSQPWRAAEQIGYDELLSAPPGERYAPCWSVVVLTPLSERLLPGPVAYRGQILIVAYISNWSDPNERQLARLRSELRCVSACLVLMGPTQLLCFQPDDSYPRAATREPCHREDFDALLAPLSQRSFRHDDVAQRPRLRVVLVNPSGAIAWSHEGRAIEQPITALIDALSRARRHLLDGPGRIYGITRQDLVGSLTTAFAAEFGSHRPLGALAKAEEPREIFDRASGEGR